MENSKGAKEGLTVYELSFLILPSIPEDKVVNVVDSIRKVVINEGGVEIDGEAPFKQPLSYSMSKTIGASRYVVDDAYLGWIKFEIEPAKALAVKTGIEKISEILRFLMIKTVRETTFTFAQARKAIVETEAGAASPSSFEEAVVAPTLEEVGVPTETSGNKL